jgi:hypothetical protein
MATTASRNALYCADVGMANSFDPERGSAATTHDTTEDSAVALHRMRGGLVGAADGAPDGAALGTALGALDGAAVGTPEGAAVGADDGKPEGAAVGATVGTPDGSDDGAVLGSDEGGADGRPVGTALGASVGLPDGAPDGALDGHALGAAVGTPEGTALGAPDGAALGTAVGDALGPADGVLDGTSVGAVLGAPVGASDGAPLGAADGAGDNRLPNTDVTTPSHADTFRIAGDCSMCTKRPLADDADRLHTLPADTPFSKRPCTLSDATSEQELPLPVTPTLHDGCADASASRSRATAWPAAGAAFTPGDINTSSLHVAAVLPCHSTRYHGAELPHAAPNASVAAWNIRPLSCVGSLRHTHV